VTAGHRHKFYRQPFAPRAREQIEALNAGEIMTAPVTCVRPDSSAREVARVMRTENVGVVPVVGPGEKLLGLITDRDIVVRAIAEGAVDNVTAGDIMTPAVTAVEARELIARVLSLMIERRIRRVPVVDSTTRLLGIVSLDDIVNRADQHDEVVDTLRALAGRRRFWAAI